MGDRQDKSLASKIFNPDLKRQARIQELAPHITMENMHDGSARSLEYSILAVEALDEYLASMDLCLASPLVVDPQRSELEKWRQIFLSKRTNAKRAVELNTQA